MGGYTSALACVLPKAWRYPCYTVSDVQLMEAVAPPDGVAPTDNAITYSDQGHGNTLMAGWRLGILSGLS